MALANRPRRPAVHKKFSGQHHKHTKHYVKAYLPYLPLAAIVTAGLLINGMLFGPGKVLGSQTNMSSQDFLQSTNQQRTADREAPLNLNAQLSAAAQAKANDMVTRDYWSHTTPDGKQPWAFIAAAGYTYQYAGENLAYGFSDAKDVVNGWMNSREHRANVLNENYQDVGFGVASSPNFAGHGPETVVVALYGAPVVYGSAVLGSTSIPASRTIARVQVLTHGAAPWSVLLVSLIGLGAVAIVANRHLSTWHRTLTRSEVFIVQHAWLDVLLVSLAMTAYVLSRAAGMLG